MSMMRRLTVCLLTLVIIIGISYGFTSNASGDWNGILKDVTDTPAESGVATPVRTMAQSVITITQVIGVGIAVIMLIVLGMKYMISAPDDKAQIKKHAVVYVIGAVVLFGAAGILEIIKNFAGAAKG